MKSETSVTLSVTAPGLIFFRLMEEPGGGMRINSSTVLPRLTWKNLLADQLPESDRPTKGDVPSDAATDLLVMLGHPRRRLF